MNINKIYTQNAQKLVLVLLGLEVGDYYLAIKLQYWVAIT